MTDNSPKQTSPEPSAPVEKVPVEPKADQLKQDGAPEKAQQDTPVAAGAPVNATPVQKNSPIAEPSKAKPAAPDAEPQPALSPAQAQLESTLEDTKVRKPASKVELKTETQEQEIAAAQVPDVDNPYILSGEVDRARLVLQSRQIRHFIEASAKRLVGENLKSILDIGCGEGQITLALAKLYPGARIVGIDKDEKAIEVARRAARDLPNVEFVVGDVQESLPAGPFDLVFESLCLTHIPNAAKVIQLAFSVMQPGGYLWSKEVDPGLKTAIDNPEFKRLIDMFQSAMARMGGRTFISQDLPGLLSAAGFTDVRAEVESYPFGNTSTEGRVNLAFGLGAIYNARKMISKLLQTPESDIEKVYKATLDAVMAPNGPTGHWPVANTIARRPEKVASGDNQGTLPDLENPYVLSGEVDRARLVAQTRLFRNYIERNAKLFLGDDVKSILDMGCGEGQLTLVFAKLYPQATILGIDKDEKAIEVAQRAAKGMPNVEFRVGDILQSLPSGPFDLVYESLVLMHVPGTPKIIKSVYDVLKPGGRLWTKDLHPNMETAVNHPAFERLSKWMGTTMERIGAPWRIGGELAPILTNTGFKILKTEEEVYTLGNRSTEERITMSINLGALYNARKLMTRVLQVPEIEMENAYKELAAAMMAPNGPRGNFVYMNVISERPTTTS